MTNTREIVPVEFNLKYHKSVKTFMWLQRGCLIDDSITTHGVWEGYTTWAFERLVVEARDAMGAGAAPVVWDVGANIGYYTVLGGLLGCAVHAFESMEEACRISQRNIELSHLEARTSLVRALVSRETKATAGLLYTNYLWPPPPVEDRKPEAVPTLCLDDYLEQTKIRPDIIKIDTDGYELDVVEGAIKVLRTKPRLILEVTDYCLKEKRPPVNDEQRGYGWHSMELLDQLQRLGYRFLREETWEPIEPKAVLTAVDLSRSGLNLICL